MMVPLVLWGWDYDKQNKKIETDISNNISDFL